MTNHMICIVVVSVPQSEEETIVYISFVIKPLLIQMLMVKIDRIVSGEQDFDEIKVPFIALFVFFLPIGRPTQDLKIMVA